MVDFKILITFAFLSSVHAVKIVNGVENLVEENNEVAIECKAEANCSFVNPSGKQFSPGSEGSPIDTTKSQLADIQQRVSTDFGEEVTLSCTTLDRAPVRYCQFVPPAGNPFSIDPDVTPEKAIQERYYFPPNKSLDRGDCAVSISKVKYEDVGRWTCSARLDDGEEHLVTIVLQLKGVYTLPEGSVYLLGAVPIAVVAFIAILVFLLKRRRQWWRRLSVRAESIPDAESQGSRIRGIPVITVQPPTPSPNNSRRYSP